jgi:UDP-glucose 6-dehydrogenase
MVKCATNSFYALKTVFFNELYDCCRDNDVVPEGVFNVISGDIRIGDSHNHVFHKGGRGAGGGCLRKDINAFADFSGSELLDVVRKINEKLLKYSGKI